MGTRTYVELYRAVLGGLKEMADLRIHFGLSEDELEAALLPLRNAKILQTVSVLFTSGRYVAIGDEATTEAEAIKLATAAGLDLGNGF